MSQAHGRHRHSPSALLTPFSFLRGFTPKASRHQMLPHNATHAQTSTIFWSSLASDGPLLIWVSCESSWLRAKGQIGLMASENSSSLMEWARGPRGLNIAQMLQTGRTELPTPTEKWKVHEEWLCNLPIANNGRDPRGEGAEVSNCESSTISSPSVPEKGMKIPVSTLFRLWISISSSNH